MPTEARPSEMANDKLVSPKRLVGGGLDELLAQEWPTMRQTRARAEKANRVIDNDDPFVLPATFAIAGADQYVAQIPHPQTVPQRMLQRVIAKRPHLSIPLGPKGLGITGQRLTTRVEQPLNAICEDKRAGFKFNEMAAYVLFHGWAAGITVLDPADWQKRPSPWEDEETRTWAARYRVDGAGRSEGEANYTGTVDDARARRKHELDLAVHRARNLPIRHRAVGIINSAPIFGPDLSVEGLLVSQEFSISYLQRHYEFGDAGVATPTGGNGRDGAGNASTSGRTGRALTLIEAWLYDEDGLPYVSYAIKGGQCVEARWKGRGADYDGKLATIDLKDRFGLDRLPIAWGWGLGNPAETNPDRRAIGFLEPFMQGWRSVRAKMTANNVSIALLGYPVLIEESDGPLALSGGLDEVEPDVPDIAPLKITQARPGTRLRQLELKPISESTYKQIDLELGANADEAPGTSNKDQSGFSQSMAEAFEELAMTTVHDTLGDLYESHGSYTLEAGKRMPEQGRTPNHKDSGYAPIMVFESTDVPVSDTAGDHHNEPMELDPDLIDPSFTVKARYDRSMSIPERQQSMEEVARTLKTRRKHLEDAGDESPETTELELIVEAHRGTPQYAAALDKMVAQILGSDDLKEIAQAQKEGLADDAGMPNGLNAGVAPPPPPGMLPPPQQGAPGVPDGGSVTGGAGPQYGQNALAGVVGGASMTGPINNAVQNGGVVPPSLPTPGGM